MPQSPVKRRLNAPRAGAAGSRGGKDRRGRDLARIHILAGQIGLDDDSYRDILWVQGRVDSAKDLDSHGRAQVIAHLQGLAERLGKARPAKKYPKRPNNIDAETTARELKKVEALLADAGLPWAYAEKILQQQTRGRVRRLEWAGANELVGVLAALHRQAIKRLSAELKQALGEDWENVGAVMAALGFDFDLFRRTFTAYPQAMSQVLRWQRGQLAAACVWPPVTSCCIGCAQRMRKQQHEAESDV